MNKKKLLAGLIMGLALLMSGCNRDLIDTVWKYDYAIMELPDGRIIEGDVEQWKDYEGDVIQVRIDGVTYYIHSENIVLIADKRWDSELPTVPVLEDK